MSQSERGSEPVIPAVPCIVNMHFGGGVPIMPPPGRPPFTPRVPVMTINGTAPDRSGNVMLGALASKDALGEDDFTPEMLALLRTVDPTLTLQGVAADAKAAGDALARKQDAIEDLDGIRSGAALGATSVQDVSGKAEKSEMSVSPVQGDDTKKTVQLKSGLSLMVVVGHQSLDAYFNGVEYRQSYGEQNIPAILFKHGSDVVAALNATPFIKDGMISSVAVSGGNLVITFNTDAGKNPISIPLTDIFNPSNYYDKTAADGRFVQKETGKGLSTNDYTTAEKSKLAACKTKAEIDAGWLSDWTYVVHGDPFTPSGERTLRYVQPGLWSYGRFENDFWVETDNCDGAEDATQLSFSNENGDTCYATRHRVAGPVPTKPSDIGAQPALTFDATPTANSANPVTSGGVKAALDGKASTADATLTPIYSQTPTFSEWTFSGTSPSSGHHWEVTWDLISQEYRLFDVPDGQTWENVVDSSEYTGPSEYVVNIDDTLTTVVFPTVGVTATRTRTDIIGYTLGSQTDKPLVSEAEAEALRNGKANRASSPTAGNLAALDAQGNLTDSGVKPSDKLDTTSAAPAFSTSSTYAVGEYVTYNGKLYRCTTAVDTAGAWDAASWTAVAITDEMGVDTPLPFDAECEYVTVPAGAYILPEIANVSADIVLSMNVRIDQSGLSNNSRFLVGNWRGLTGNSTQIYVKGTTSTAGGGFNFYSDVSVNPASVLDSFAEVGIYGSRLTFGTNTVNTGSPGSRTCEPLDIAIGGAVLSDNSVEAGNHTFDLASFFYAANGAAVRDMLPVRVGTVGYLYDKVSGRLFGSAVGGIPLVPGPDKAQPTIVTPGRYVEIKPSMFPYDLGTPTVINAASSETVEGETVYYGAATLANRAANIVQVTAALDELRITFPAATSGKVRDFGLRVEIGTGSAALAAPALVPPAGVTLENADAEIPALADGTATAKGVTLLYFSETAPGVFVVKGEQVEEVA